MKLAELISEDLILTDLKASDVPGVLREFSEAICAAGKFTSPDILFDRLYDREQQGSTGIGKGIAIPHCKVENLQQVTLAVAYSKEGVDFKALDGNLTYFFFLLISPANSSVLHLRALASLSRLLKSPAFVSHLKERPSPGDLITSIKKEEETTLVK